MELISEKSAKQYIQFITSFNFSVEFPQNICQDEYLDAMLLDKKNTNNTLRFMLINQIEDLQLLDIKKSLLREFLSK